MADGFIVAERNEETGNAIAFWNGSELVEDMQVATLAGSKQDARLLAGSLQSQYPEKEIVILPARTAIELLPTPPIRPVIPATNAR